MKFIDGYKTYIVSAILILAVLAEKLLGFDVPGVNVSDNWFEVLAAALGLGALRHGVAKAGRVAKKM